MTARFNRNALTDLNRELGSKVDGDSFRHRASWNPEAAQIEMHQVATRSESVPMPSLAHTEAGEGCPSCPFSRTAEPGQVIVTGHSYKYTREPFAALITAAGWTRTAGVMARAGLLSRPPSGDPTPMSDVDGTTGDLAPRPWDLNTSGPPSTSPPYTPARIRHCQRSSRHQREKHLMARAGAQFGTLR